jgi:Cu-Zn family superoxide dismutase
MFTVSRMTLIAAASALIGTAMGVHAQQTAEAVFYDRQGKQIGAATLQQMPAGVLIRIDVAGLPPGEHAFHIHEKGRCDAQDGFKSAGDHFSPEKKPHGYLGKLGHHAGDMPNQFVFDNGRLRADLLNAHVQLSDASLLDQDGSALVIHAGPDDYLSQPAGNAGDRIACAVIKLGKARAATDPPILAGSVIDRL